MFGIGTLFYSILFFINGIAVLSEDRFLARIGWSAKSNNNTNNVNNNSSSQFTNQYGYGDYNMNNGIGQVGYNDGIKTRLINLISATRTLLRIPLIIVNVLVIIYELILG